MKPLNKLEGSYTKFLNKIENTQLLILNDFGRFEFNNTARYILMDIVETKHDKSSIILTSQIPVKMWHWVDWRGNYCRCYFG
ncbi:MAG: ATP-binding protein [Flavobacteriaceae bacterium]|nr:ATP-binding protein [Flavobacteriaceae bacterium]